MKKVIVLILLLAVFGTVRANLVSNPGFEDGTWTADDSSEPDSWWTYGYYASSVTWKDNSANAHGGSKYMNLNGWFSASYTGGWVADAQVGQDFAASAGVEYLFTAWVKENGVGNGGGEVGFEARFRDSGGGWIEWPSITVPTTNEWSEISFTATAPAGTSDVQILLRNYGTADGGVLVDDASVVPEPISIALFGIGGLMLIRRKK